MGLVVELVVSWRGSWGWVELAMRNKLVPQGSSRSHRGCSIAGTLQLRKYKLTRWMLPQHVMSHLM